VYFVGWEVDLCRQLGVMLREYVGDRRAGLLFHSSTGAQLLQSNALSDSLHPIPDYMAHERGGSTSSGVSGSRILKSLIALSR